MALILTIVVLAEIMVLFYLNRDAEARPSRALWIPVTWMLIVGSREISEWMSLRNQTTVATKFTEGNLSDALGFAFLMFLAALVLNHRSQQVAGILQRNLPLLLFLFYCGISVLWSDFPGNRGQKMGQSNRRANDGAGHSHRSSSCGSPSGTFSRGSHFCCFRFQCCSLKGFRTWVPATTRLSA